MGKQRFRLIITIERNFFFFERLRRKIVRVPRLDLSFTRASAYTRRPKFDEPSNSRGNSIQPWNKCESRCTRPERANRRHIQGGLNRIANRPMRIKMEIRSPYSLVDEASEPPLRLTPILSRAGKNLIVRHRTRRWDLFCNA